MAQVIPASVTKLTLGQRIRWARKRAGLSHDQLVGKLGRSNRSHLIKIEKGIVLAPRRDLRDAIADATGVPRELFNEDDDEEDPLSALMSAIRRVVREEIAKEWA